MCALVVVLAPGCERDKPEGTHAPQTAEPAPEPKPESESEPKPKPKPQPTPEPEPEPQALFAAVDLSQAPEVVAAALAEDWCRHGGESFRPPPAPGAAPDDDYPPQVECCEDFEIEIRDRQQAGGLNATLFNIDAAYYEARDLLLLQTESDAALVQLHHEVEDESGEGAVWRQRFADIELRDVTGTSTPEWIATSSYTGGDNFEADRCYRTNDDALYLIVCSAGEQGFACFETRVRSMQVVEPRSKDQLYDCTDNPGDLDPRSVSGYDQRFELRRDTLVLRRNKNTKVDEPDEPPHTGSVPLTSLFEDEALAVGVFEYDDDE